MLDYLWAFGEGLGFWVIAAICALVVVFVIGLGFYLLGPVIGCIFVLIVVVVYSVVRILFIKAG